MKDAITKVINRNLDSCGEYDLRMEVIERNCILSTIMQFFDDENLWDKFNEEIKNKKEM